MERISFEYVDQARFASEVRELVLPIGVHRTTAKLQLGQPRGGAQAAGTWLRYRRRMCWRWV